MRSTIISAAAVVLAGVQSSQAQTFSACNPMKNVSCPANPALGTSVFYDFTKTDSLPADWSALPGTTPKFSEQDGLIFSIDAVTNAPTIAFTKYIMFGKVEAYVKASQGAGIVSSVILLSDTLDEIDWEWTGGDSANVQSNFFGKANTQRYDREQHVAVANALESVHKYTIEWTESEIKWSVDDNAATTRVLPHDSPLAEGGAFYPQTPMQVKLGNWVGCPTKACFDDVTCATHGTCQWVGGYYEQSGPGPYVMTIANITISDYSCGTAYSYGDMTGNFPSIRGNTACTNSTTSTVTDGAATTASSTSSTAPLASGPAAPLNLGQGNATTDLASGVAHATGKPSASTNSPGSPGSGSSGILAASGAEQASRASGLVQIAVLALGLGLGALVM